MIRLTGSLVVKIINGRNGAFRVGSLQTDIGIFAVKEKILDQYEEGSYEGVFDISRIFSSNYSTGSRLVVEVRAIVENIALENVDNTPPDQYDSLEQDPLDEELDKETGEIKNLSQNLSESRTEETNEQQAEGAEQTKKALESDQDADAVLFGLLWPLQDRLKLDPTVDRVLFRRQGQRLKLMGYIFNPVNQDWVKT